MIAPRARISLAVAAGVILIISGSWLATRPVATGPAAVETVQASLGSAPPPGSTAPASTVVPTRGPGPGSSPTPEPPPVLADVAIVPVISFRAGWASTDAAEVARVVAGESERYTAIEVVAADREAVVGSLGLEALDPGEIAHVVVASDPERLTAHLANHPDRLGFLRADDVTPAVRAIGWDGRELFGAARVPKLEDWPLSIPSAASVEPLVPAYDPGAAWTLVAGGDVNLDGAVAVAVANRRRGVDYPWDGGTAEITSRFCCSADGFELARVRRTGDRGEIRALLSGADLAIANFENPAPDDFTYHPGGFVFSADPALIEGLANAGIDWVSLANNHIGDAGATGVRETITNLERWGIAHGGAGRNRRVARAPSLHQAGDVDIAILAYDTIRPAYAAGPSRPGSNQMSVRRVRHDVAEARAAGAEVVIVYPHWGIEYTAETTAWQRELARAATDAGADLVLGNHSHSVGAMEVRDGRPILYSLGDFVFNIARSEQTMEGILAEATFIGGRLVQLRIHPFFIVGGVQPNLLDPAGSGEAVMTQLFDASGALLPW